MFTSSALTKEIYRYLSEEKPVFDIFLSLEGEFRLYGGYVPGSADGEAYDLLCVFKPQLSLFRKLFSPPKRYTFVQEGNTLIITQTYIGKVLEAGRASFFRYVFDKDDKCLSSRTAKRIQGTVGTEGCEFRVDHTLITKEKKPILTSFMLNWNGG